MLINNINSKLLIIVINNIMLSKIVCINYELRCMSNIRGISYTQ